MPVQLGSKLPRHAEARIEIVPLIDIMFFLLASFMLATLSMVNLKSVKVKLPTATSATPESLKQFASISVDSTGLVFLDKTPVGENELVTQLKARKTAEPNLRVFISADRDSRHGEILHVLDLVRSCGIDNVGFEARPPASGSAPAPASAASESAQPPAATAKP